VDGTCPEVMVVCCMVILPNVGWEQLEKQSQRYTVLARQALKAKKKVRPCPGLVTGVTRSKQTDMCVCVSQNKALMFLKLKR